MNHQPVKNAAGSALRAAGALVALIVAVVFSGCTMSYNKTSALMTAAWQSGNYGVAADIATKQSKAAGEDERRDRLVWQLEAGATLRANKQWQASNAAFDAALETIASYDAKPETSITGEAFASLTNLSTFPYRGTGYDRIMLSTYQALNYLALGESEKARVALNLALVRQQEAVAANAKRLENAQRERASAKSGGQRSYDADRAANTPQVAGALGKEYAEDDAIRQVRSYANYVNPFSVWLHGVYFLRAGEGGSDFERAYKSLERAAAMTGNTYAQHDFELARKARDSAGSAKVPPVVYVIYETGVAPSRREVRINIPLFVVSNHVPWVVAAFPKLAYNRDAAPALILESNAPGYESVTTQPLVSMDAVIATDFKNEWPGVLTRTLISTGLKATISWIANEAARRGTQNLSGNAAIVGGIIRLSTYVGTAAYSVATTAADLRTWHTLPKEIQIARIPLPADGALRLRSANGSQTPLTLNLQPGVTNIVHVRATGNRSPLVVSTFPLRP
jgi:hypothetical protein